MTQRPVAGKTGVRGHAARVLIGFMLLFVSAANLPAAPGADREQFMAAWNAASRGDHGAFSHLPQSLAQYELFPYLVYEDLRHRRAQINPEIIADFLQQHADWAFAPALRSAWLKSLGRKGAWEDLLKNFNGSGDTVLRCFRARAMIETRQLEGLLQEAQSLWTVGKSQPGECDPVFSWLRKYDGITPALAWERVRLAMQAGNPRFTLYLARYIPAKDREWLSGWQDLDRKSYRDLGKTTDWPDQELTRMITAVSLQRLAKRDPEKAWQAFRQIDSHFNWPAETRAGVIREIALQAAVDLSDITPEVMGVLPASYRDDQLLQWWARKALTDEDWASLNSVITQMPPETRADARWRYWQAEALERTGDAGQATEIRDHLSREANYYGFLAADQLQRPYSICPLEPAVSPEAVDEVRLRPGISRALELRAAGLENWALSEWTLASSRLDIEGLRAAAALAREENWHDRVIFSLGDSGDRQFYDWRFPILWEQQVSAESASNHLDPSWVHGVMRSESALAASARSSAGALGLMQITPATATRLARQHGLAYRGREQLKDAGLNIRFGTRFMRELLDRYDQNPVLVSGAYNAGPRAVDRWLDSRPRGEADVWIETIPYYETRDYIPRVLAFTAIYDWRMNRPVTRVSSRMPDLDSGNITTRETTEVVCSASG